MVSTVIPLILLLLGTDHIYFLTSEQCWFLIKIQVGESFLGPHNQVSPFSDRAQESAHLPKDSKKSLLMFLKITLTVIEIFHK